jgi:hypothetical protein
MLECGRRGYDSVMHFRPAKGILPAMICAFAALLAGPLLAQGHGASGVQADITSAQIVERMIEHNKSQTGALKHYQALRHYDVEYRGFASRIAAKMEVEVSFDAATGKSLRIVSQSGSAFLCDKVLKRAVESEKEASQDKQSTALTETNYRFRLGGSESIAGRPAYMLDVEPLTASKFLYRGRIWVDAADFAVVKMETEPAKSPSFWIARTLIHYTSAKTDGFWLPEQMRSETKVRIGGTAVLTINYGSYTVVPEEAVRAAGS